MAYKVYQKEEIGKFWIDTSNLVLYDKIWSSREKRALKPEIPKCLQDKMKYLVYHGSDSYENCSSAVALNDLHGKEEDETRQLISSDKTFSDQDYDEMNIRVSGEVPEEVLKELDQLLQNYPDGLALEKLNHNYWRMYGKHLIPVEYGFKDMVDLIQSLTCTFLVKEDAHEHMLLKRRQNGLIMEEEQEDHTSSVPFDIKETFCAILNARQGFCLLDNLLPEYEMRTGMRLDIAKMGFKSVFDFVGNLKDIFDLRRLSNGQFVLYDPGIPMRKVPPIQEHNAAFSDPQHQRRSLGAETISRIRRLLEVEYPGGLIINEVVGAYRGLFGATLTDLDYKDYGYSSLEGLLRAHPEIVTIQDCRGAVCVMSEKSLLSRKDMQSWSASNSELPEEAVGLGASYKCQDIKALMPPGMYVEVVVAEVYSPHKFWMIHKGVHTSQALDALMDQMFEFYGSPISERYLVSKEAITMGCPVVALYTSDLNYYRAIVTCLEDLTTVKLFFVDFGTICRCDLSALRLIHRNFFDLPAQAVKASLCDVSPLSGRRLWSRSSSRRFLEMVQDQTLVAQIISAEKTVSVCLWDTTGQQIMSIGQKLANEGFAVSCNVNATTSAMSGLSSCRKEVDETECHSDTSISSQLIQEGESYQFVGEGVESEKNYIFKAENAELGNVPEVSHINTGTGANENTHVNTIAEGFLDVTSLAFSKTNILNLTDIIIGLLQTTLSELQKKNATLKYLIMGKSQLGMEQMTRSSTTSQHVLQSTLSEALSSKSPMVAMPVTSRENISKRDTSSIYTEEHRLLKGISLSNHVTAADYTNETRLVDESPTGFSPLLIHEPTVGSIINLAPEKVDAQTLMEPSEDIFYSDESDETTEQIDSSVNPVIFKNKHTFNLVFLNCEPYVLSGEISSILWDSDILETVLQESGINVPSVKMTVRSHPNIYLQLIEFEADVYDNTGKLRPTLTVFLLGALPSILKCFNHYDTDLLLWIQELCDVYDTNFEKMSIKNSISSQATHSGIKKIDQGNAQFNENGYQKQFAYRLLNMQTTAYEDETESIRTASLRNTGDTMLCVKSITPSEIHKCMHLVHKIFGTGDDMAIARESANEDFLIEPDTQDCVDKLIELAKSDERYLGTIETIEMLKRDLPHNPYLKEDLCKLIECIKEIWNRSHPDRKQMNLDGLRQSEQQYENGQISSARYTDENSNMCRNLVPATMKRFQEKPLEELSNLDEIEKEQCFFPVLDKSNCVARKETLPRSTNGKMLLNQTTIPMQYGAGNAGEEIIQKNTWFDEDDQLQRTNHEIVLKRQCDDKILLGKLDITYSSFGNEKTSLENSQWRRQDVLPTNVLGENVPENLHTLQTLEQSYVAKKPPQKFMLRSLRR